MLARFSTTLDKDYYDEAMNIRKIMKTNKSFEEFGEPQFNVNTVKVFKRQFTFPQIALNDYAKDQLETLETEQAAMNLDPDVSSSPASFLATAKQVAIALKTKYGEQWINPTSIKPPKSTNKKVFGKKPLKKKSTKNINKYKKDLEKKEEQQIDIDEIVEASLKDINMEYL